MSVYLTTSYELSTIAAAIRRKANISGEILYPEGYVDAIDSIDTTPSEVEVTAVGTVEKIQDTEDDYLLTLVASNS